MTLTEKIIAAHAGLEAVSPGQFVVVDVDFACVDDVQFSVFAQTMRELDANVSGRPRTLLIADHYSPPSGADEADTVQQLTDFGRLHRIPTLLSEGIKHPVFLDRQLVMPGQLMGATDSHTNTAGAIAALAVALGPSDLAAIFATGKTWLKVPETIRMEIDGTLSPYVMAVDIGLSLLKIYGRFYASYKTIEWAGSTVRSMPLPGRMTLCNLTTEFGAKNGIVEADSVTQEYAPALTSLQSLQSDLGAEFHAVHARRAEEFGVVVAAPPSPANVFPVEDLKGIKVHQAYLGTCTHSTLEDLHQAARVLAGRRVHPSVKLLVTPATQRVYAQALHDGTLALLVGAGGTICSPGCGSCPGMHEGTLAAHEVRISTQSRNFTGRSGHPLSQVYLGSPLTVAAAAVAGEIVSPAEILA